MKIGGRHMAKTEKTNKIKTQRSAEEREKYLTSLAMDQIEAQLKAGTAPASVLNHFLKKADRNDADLDKKIKEQQVELLTAKAGALSKDDEAVRIAKEAEKAFRGYKSGTTL